ncbi:MAG: hypothetical protein JWQ35_608 [Bacteriovoracaceae bacterium]|nr:hypothetical protein [Bacteriovoracaceae bacterium]
MLTPVIVAWANGSAREFEEAVPLEFIGRHNQKRNFYNQIQILFLEGFDRLDADYKDRLRALGYQIHNVEQIFQTQKKKFSGLLRFNSYELKCFLRWPVIQEFFLGQPLVHFDGDIVFNIDPKELISCWENLDFVLQGCPAVTVMKDQKWLEVYHSELMSLSKDVEGYSKSAWKRRVGWEATQYSKWAGARLREVVSSDQDLISHLIHTNLLPQNDPQEVLRQSNDLVLFEQPLSFDLYFSERPVAYRREAGVDFMNQKRVGLWHMQSDFCHYLLKAIAKKEHLSWFLRSRLSRDYEGVQFLIYRIYRRLLFGKRLPRLFVYKYFFEENDFSCVFKDQVWWKSNILKSKN